jgi:hypothetical protein
MIFVYDGKKYNVWHYTTKTGREMAQCPFCLEKRTVKSLSYHMNLCQMRPRELDELLQQHAEATGHSWGSQNHDGGVYCLECDRLIAVGVEETK